MASTFFESGFVRQSAFLQKRILFLLLFLVGFSGQIDARTHYVDGSQSGKQDSGTVSPLQKLIDSKELENGDQIILRSGYYGHLKIKGRAFKDVVAIVAEKGHEARFASISISSSKNIRISGVRVSPSHEGPLTSYSTLVKIEQGSEHLVLENSEFFSIPVNSKWSEADWGLYASDGIVITGSRHITLRNNKVRNINHGIYVEADGSHIENNVIESFSGTAIRGAGNYSTFQNNIIRNCYKGGRGKTGGLSFLIADNAGEKKISGGALRSNRIISHEDPLQKNACELPGISLSGGLFSKWTIENNVVITDHWNGIVARGAQDVVIMHNTVFNPYKGSGQAVQISISKNKNDKQSKGNLILNNIGQGIGDTGPETFAAGNIIVRSGERIFARPEALDFRLRKGSRAINTAITPKYFATVSNLPFPNISPRDISGTARPQGRGADVGAFEWIEK